MHSSRDRMIAFLMVLPSLIILGIFVYYFIGRAVQTSFTDWGENPARPPLQEGVETDFVGWQNYDNLMSDMIQSNFRVSLVNTFFLTVFFVGGCILVGLFLAILLDQNVVGEGFFRTVFLFPMSLSFVVTGTIWRWMLQPNGGINVLPTYIGLPPIDFAWISSQAVWWQFTWTNVPQYLTWVGFAVLAFIAVRYAIQQEWRSVGFTAAAAIIVVLVFVFGEIQWSPN
ncbi:MAG: sugar ABC transporter permease [Chloroflexota bacterium]